MKKSVHLLFFAMLLLRLRAGLSKALGIIIDINWIQFLKCLPEM